MKQSILALTVAAALFSACSDEDEIVEVKDYGLKSFEANLSYNSEAAHGEVAYKEQTYFAFGEENAIGSGTFGTDSWTTFFLIPDTTAYNVTASVEDWDLLLSYYVEALEDEGEVVPYGVTGVLLNTEKGIRVAKLEYTDSEEETAITQAFANLALSEVSGLTFSSDINTIGHSWKAFDLSAMMYTVHSNWFYIVKMTNGDTYKLRFISFYGASTSERVIKFEYQLMQ